MDKINPEVYEEMNAVAKMLAEKFKPHGFTLLVFDYGVGGCMNYISSAKREDMLAAMKEFIAKNEGRLAERPKVVQ